MGSEKEGCAILGLIYSIRIIVTVLCVILSWDIVKPNSFWSAIGFFLLLGILSIIANTIINIVTTVIVNFFK